MEAAPLPLWGSVFVPRVALTACYVVFCTWHISWLGISTYIATSQTFYPEPFSCLVHQALVTAWRVISCIRRRRRYSSGWFRGKTIGFRISCDRALISSSRPCARIKPSLSNFASISLLRNFTSTSCCALRKSCFSAFRAVLSADCWGRGGVLWNGLKYLIFTR